MGTLSSLNAFLLQVIWNASGKNAFFCSQGINGQFYYVMKDPSDAFELDKLSGQIYVVRPELLDREKRSKFSIEVSGNKCKIIFFRI